MYFKWLNSRSGGHFEHRLWTKPYQSHNKTLNNNSFKQVECVQHVFAIMIFAWTWHCLKYVPRIIRQHKLICTVCVYSSDLAAAVLLVLQFRQRYFLNKRLNEGKAQVTGFFFICFSLHFFEGKELSNFFFLWSSC